MKILHVSVQAEDGWLIAQGLEEPGVITQARSLDELLFMVRDAASLLLGVKDLHIELILPPNVPGKSRRRPRHVTPRKTGAWKKSGARV